VTAAVGVGVVSVSVSVVAVIIVSFRLGLVILQCGVAKETCDDEEADGGGDDVEIPGCGIGADSELFGGVGGAFVVVIVVRRLAGGFFTGRRLFGRMFRRCGVGSRMLIRRGVVGRLHIAARHPPEGQAHHHRYHALCCSFHVAKDTNRSRVIPDGTW